MGQEWLTVDEVRIELRVHAMTVYRLIKSGRLGAVRVGRSYRIKKSDFEKYLREARAQ